MDGRGRDAADLAGVASTDRSVSPVAPSFWDGDSSEWRMLCMRPTRMPRTPPSLLSPIEDAAVVVAL
jgi:hypothetical protein